MRSRLVSRFLCKDGRHSRGRCSSNRSAETPALLAHTVLFAQAERGCRASGQSTRWARAGRPRPVAPLLRRPGQ